MDKLALAQPNHEKERKLVEQTKEYMHRKAAEVNVQPKKEISDKKLRLLCLQSCYNLKPISIELQQCDVAKEQNKLHEKEANKTDFNVSQNEPNKADLITTENDKNKGDLNGAKVDEKSDSNASETEQSKGDLNGAKVQGKSDSNVSEPEQSNGDLNGAEVTAKSDSNSSETEQSKGDLTENDENKEDSTQGENSASTRRRSARPKRSLEESDPLLKAFQENSPEEVDALLQEDAKKVNRFMHYWARRCQHT